MHLGSTIKRFQSHPVSTSLMLVQVLLGSLAMVLGLSAYLGVRSPSSANSFMFMAGSKVQSNTSIYSLFTDNEVSQLLKSSPDVETVTLYQDEYDVSLSYNGKEYVFSKVATVGAEYFSISKLHLTSGDVFGSLELEQSEPVIVISDLAAEILFGKEDPIGKRLVELIEGTEGGALVPVGIAFTVIGVFSTSNTDGDDLFGTEPVHAFFPPWAPSNFSTETFKSSALLVRAKPGQFVAAREQLLSAADQLYNRNNELGGLASDHSFFFERLDELNRDPLPLILNLFGITAFIISSVGIFSTTLVTVAERTREIGIRRALGATRRRVIGELIQETTTLALIASTLGVVLALLIGRYTVNWIEAVSSLDITLGPTALSGLIVLLTTIVISSILSLPPALKASRINPIEATRYAK